MKQEKREQQQEAISAPFAAPAVPPPMVMPSPYPGWPATAYGGYVYLAPPIQPPAPASLQAVRTSQLEAELYARKRIERSSTRQPSRLATRDMTPGVTDRASSPVYSDVDEFIE